MKFEVGGLRTFFLLPLVSLALGLAGCKKEEPSPLPPVAQAPSAPKELTEAFVARALAGLNTRLAPESKILEMRVTGSVFSLHMQAKKDLPASDQSKAIPRGSLVQLDYFEKPGEKGQPPLGQIRGPVRVEVKGQGEVKDNLFPMSEVNLTAIARAFRIAVLAVDPEDGRVERLVIRRNLPFGRRVRGRIYVHSPRMSGSIDVNEKGTPLKR